MGSGFPDHDELDAMLDGLEIIAPRVTFLRPGGRMTRGSASYSTSNR
ncbi:hypothetical protein ACPZ19_38420 [Amycolatopsis lurida]